MADTDRNTSPLPKPNSFYRPSHFSGSTITDLEDMVEKCITTGPLMSLAQIRILLRVEQACENCEGLGYTESRGLSPEVSQERCPVCKGKGYVVPQKEEVTQ